MLLCKCDILATLDTEELSSNKEEFACHERTRPVTANCASSTYYKLTWEGLVLGGQGSGRGWAGHAGHAGGTAAGAVSQLLGVDVRVVRIQVYVIVAVHRDVLWDGREGRRGGGGVVRPVSLRLLALSPDVIIVIPVVGK